MIDPALFSTTLPASTQRRAARILDELDDVFAEVRDSLSDGVLTGGELFEIGVEASQLVAALFAPVLGDPGTRPGQTSREERKATRKRDKAARRAAKAEALAEKHAARGEIL